MLFEPLIRLFVPDEPALDPTSVLFDPVDKDSPTLWPIPVFSWPLLTALNADEPSAQFLLPVADCSAEFPAATLDSPVMTENKLFEPTAVFPEPVVALLND